MKLSAALAHNVRMVRLRRRLSQAALARRAGLTQQCVSTIERGLRPTPATVRKIARALKVPEDVLTGQVPREMPA